MKVITQVNVAALPVDGQHPNHASTAFGDYGQFQVGTLSAVASYPVHIYPQLGPGQGRKIVVARHLGVTVKPKVIFGIGGLHTAEHKIGKVDEHSMILLSQK